MSNVIIYKNPTGPNVCVCIPTGELSVSEVLAKDCPTGAVVVDSASLPEADNDFFDAWRLADGKVTVDLEASRAIQLKRVNDAAIQEAQKRQLNTLAGIENKVSDADFTALLTAKRSKIASAKSTEDLRAVTVADIAA